MTPKMKLFLGGSVGALVVIMAIFIAEYFVVRKFFLEPLDNVMTEREREIATAAARHEEALAGFNEATDEMELKLSQAKTCLSAVVLITRMRTTT